MDHGYAIAASPQGNQISCSSIEYMTISNY
jgi:hypothetical protein